jgi:hypothetical protein
MTVGVEKYGLSRICFEMTRKATMPSSSEFAYPKQRATLSVGSVLK